MGKVTARRRVLRLTEGASGGPTDVGAPAAVAASDTLAVEEPLEIRLAGESVVVTMRTPGRDVELAHGWLHSEGYITGRADVRIARFCEGDVQERDPEAGAASYNIVDVQLEADRARLVALDPDLGRRHGFLATSSCGICGTQTIDQLLRRSRFDIGADASRLDARELWRATAELQRHQPVFERTGSVHGAALFAPDGTLLVAREDVGRHNAVDKVIGWALLDGRLADRRPLAGHLLVVSSRASFEIVQKAHLAGIPLLATVSGASSLAAEAADAAGITLTAFVRPGRATVLTHPERIGVAAAPGATGTVTATAEEQ